MVTYPISVRGSSYRGADKKKRAKVAEQNRIAASLTQVINEMLLKQERPIQVYGWAEIAQASGYSIAVVEKYGFSIDCGSGGFTAFRHDLTYEQAMEAHRRSGE